MRNRPHFGDPCVHCGIPHDDFPVGPCRGPLGGAIDVNDARSWSAIEYLIFEGDAVECAVGERLEAEYVAIHGPRVDPMAGVEFPFADNH